MPSSVPDCPRNVGAVRRAGTQEYSCPVDVIFRTMLSRQSCTSAVWYLSVLKGIRISTSYPASVSRPFEV